VKLGIDTCYRAGGEIGVGCAERLEFTATLLLVIPVLSLLPAVATARLAQAAREHGCAELFGHRLGIGDVAIEAIDLGLHTRGVIQNKSVLVVKGGHTTALERLVIQGIGSAAIAAALIPVLS